MGDSPSCEAGIYSGMGSCPCKMRRLIQVSDLRAAALVTISVFSSHPRGISQDSVRVLD